MEGNDGTREESEDSTMIVQMEEVMCVVRVMPFVTKLSSLGVHNRHGQGWQVSPSCFRGKKQQPTVQVSIRHPTELVYLQELLKRLQDRHVEYVQAVAKKADDDAQTAPVVVSPDTPNVLQVMMKLEESKNYSKGTNKVVLETEKEKDTAEKEVEELKRQLQPKRGPYRLAKCGQLRRRLTCGLDTFGSASSGRFLIAWPP